MTLVERFLKYVSFDTQSNEESGVTPSTPGQMVFARFLKEELEALGLEEITYRRFAMRPATPTDMATSPMWVFPNCAAALPAGIRNGTA